MTVKLKSPTQPVSSPSMVQSLEGHNRAPTSLENNTIIPVLRKPRDHLHKMEEIDPAALLDIPKLAIDAAVSRIKDPVPDYGHRSVNTPRVFSDLGASVFSVLFGDPNIKSLKQPPEQDRRFMAMIKEIEKYMYELAILPNAASENQHSEDMRKHKKFIEESMEDLEFLEKYFGILGFSRSAIINFKQFRPVNLEIDASGDRY